MDAATGPLAASRAGFVLFTGLLGVTIKLALRHVEWPVILLWTGSSTGVAVRAGDGQAAVGFGPGVAGGRCPALFAGRAWSARSWRSATPTLSWRCR